MEPENIELIGKYAKNDCLLIIAKPNSPSTKIVRWDEAKQALRVDVSAPPEKDKANREILKFFSKLLKKKIGIIHGAKSREKLLRFY